jgi:hypothetical protein
MGGASSLNVLHLSIDTVRSRIRLCHHRPVQSRAASKITNVPEMTSAKTNPKNGEMPIVTDT